VQDHDIFISGIVALCGRLGVDLMLIDDTADIDESAGLFRSRWMGVTQNIIRLRRIPFHGTSARTVELVKASGCLVTCSRPWEILFQKGKDKFSDNIVIRDSFRSYTGLDIGHPERCKVKVDLSYDAERTPLYREVHAAQQSIQSTMDQIEVRLAIAENNRGVATAPTPPKRDGEYIDLDSKLDELYVTKSMTTSLAKLCKAYVERVFHAILGSEGQKDLSKIKKLESNTNADLNWVVHDWSKDVKNGIRAVLFNEDVKSLDEKWKKIQTKLWENASTTINSKTLVDFRTNVWHPFWDGGWVEQKLTEEISKAQDQADPWLALFPRIEFFSLAMTTEESVVSFLLELLLAHVEWNNLFTEKSAILTVPTDKSSHANTSQQAASNTKSQTVLLLKFNTNGEKEKDCQKGCTDALVLFYRLLSSTQRQQLGIGVRTAYSEVGTPGRNRIGMSRSAERTFRDWPRQVSLFSREWITTVQYVLPRHDVRDALYMVPLPTGDATDEYWKKARQWLGVDLPYYKFGPAVAGTWYLGVLSGGNTDLAPDVMKEILSKDHELSRLLYRCGAPVSREFYSSKFIGEFNLAKEEKIPYADVMEKVYLPKEPAATPAPPAKGKENGTSRPEVIFPFYRTQIIKYLDVAPILYQLVCEVMRIQVKEEELKAPHDPDVNKVSPGYEEFRNKVINRVSKAFKQLDALYNEGDASLTSQQAGGGK
jgi:hypothetical protein